MSLKNYRVVFTAQEQATLEVSELPEELAADEILARTLFSWVSSGTETTGCYAGAHYQITYPCYPGYSSVSQVTAVGSGVTDLAVGDLVLGGGHSAWQRGRAAGFNRVTPGLRPEDAVFIHMFKIPLPALTRVAVRAPEKCLVTGLGLVGLCAAQLAAMFGYEVRAFDPCRERRAIAERYGIPTVDTISESVLGREIGLGIDCSGNEQAVYDLTGVMRRFGEITLVGVPWRPSCELRAQQLLHAVFYNFLTLRSGWEFDMPAHHDRFNNRTFECEAMRGMALGALRIQAEDYTRIAPNDPQQIYQDLLHRRVAGLGFLLDWTRLS